MINYTASPLDSNKTLLQAFHDIETYLKNNPIYKVYTANIGYTPGTNTYMLSNINVGENTIAENDVIFFNNAYVGIVSAVGSTEVTVNNVTDLRGPAGPKGADGVTIGRYCHSIILTDSTSSTTQTYFISCTIYNNDPTKFTYYTLRDFIVENGGRYSATGFSVIKFPSSNNYTPIVITGLKSSGVSLQFHGHAQTDPTSMYIRTLAKSFPYNDVTEDYVSQII